MQRINYEKSDNIRLKNSTEWKAIVEYAKLKWDLWIDDCRFSTKRVTIEIVNQSEKLRKNIIDKYRWPPLLTVHHHPAEEKNSAKCLFEQTDEHRADWKGIKSVFYYFWIYGVPVNDGNRWKCFRETKKNYLHQTLN